MKRIYDFIIAELGTDGLLHLTVSAMIMLFFCSFLPPFLAISLTLAIGVGKEIIWDDMLGYGYAQAKDIIADIIGVVIGLVINFIYYL